MNGAKGYEEIDMDRIDDLKTIKTVSGEVVRNEEVLYAQVHHR